MVLTGVGLDKSHRLAPLLGLLFKRSTVQHPLLAGALGEAPGCGGVRRDSGRCSVTAQAPPVRLLAALLPVCGIAQHLRLCRCWGGSSQGLRAYTPVRRACLSTTPTPYAPISNAPPPQPSCARTPPTWSCWPGRTWHCSSWWQVSAGALGAGARGWRDAAGLPRRHRGGARHRTGRRAGSDAQTKALKHNARASYTGRPPEESHTHRHTQGTPPPLHPPVAITEDARVVRPACSVLSALGAVPGATARLVRTNAVGAVSALLDSPHMVRAAAAVRGPVVNRRAGTVGAPAARRAPA